MSHSYFWVPDTIQTLFPRCSAPLPKLNWFLAKPEGKQNQKVFKKLPFPIYLPFPDGKPFSWAIIDALNVTDEKRKGG